MAYYRVFAKPTKADYQRFRSQQSPDAIMQGAETFEDWVASGGRGKLLRNTSSKATAKALAQQTGGILDFQEDKRGGIAGAVGGAFDRVGDGLGNLVDNPGFLEAALVAGGGLGASALWGPGAAATPAYAGTGAGAGLAEEAAMLGVGDAAAGGAVAGTTGGAAFPWMSNAPAGSVFAAETAAPIGGAAMTTGGPAAAATGGGLWGALKAGAPTWGQIAAGGIPALIGAYASDKQADAYGDLAKDYMRLGEPSRARYEASFDPNFQITDMPGFSEAMDVSTQSLLRKLSAGSGNPWGDPGGLTEMNKYLVGSLALPALENYRRLNAGAGGLAALTSAAPGMEGAAINAGTNVYNAIGAGAADILNPPKSLEQILGEIRKAGY